MTRLVKAAVFGLLAIGLCGSPALAKPGAKKKDPETQFKKLDANSDGSLTLQEMAGKGKKDKAKIEKRFSKLDKNSDGKVSLDEMKGGGKKKKKNKNA